MTGAKANYQNPNWRKRHPQLIREIQSVKQNPSRAYLFYTTSQKCENTTFKDYTGFAN